MSSIRTRQFNKRCELAYKANPEYHVVTCGEFIKCCQQVVVDYIGFCNAPMVRTERHGGKCSEKDVAFYSETYAGWNTFDSIIRALPVPIGVLSGKAIHEVSTLLLNLE